MPLFVLFSCPRGGAGGPRGGAGGRPGGAGAGSAIYHGTGLWHREKTRPDQADGQLYMRANEKRVATSELLLHPNNIGSTFAGLLSRWGEWLSSTKIGP